MDLSPLFCPSGRAEARHLTQALAQDYSMEDSRFYAQALAEWQGGSRDDGLLAKAYALAQGDPKVMEFQYIKLRVVQ